MDVPGRWAGGFRAWDEHGAYLATGRAATAGRILRVPAAELRRLSDARGSPSACTSSRACPGPPGTTSRWPGSGRRSPPSARWPPGWRTSSTTPRPPPRGRSTPSARRMRACCRPSRRLAPAPITADQFAALDALRQELEPRRAGGPAWLSPTARTPSRTGCPTHDVTRDWVLAPGARRRRCRRRLVRAGRRGARRGHAGAGARVGGDHPGLDGLLEEVKESTRRISDLVSAVQVLRPARPGLAAADRPRRGAREHAGDARPPASPHGVTVVRRLRRRRPPRSRRSPPSSTRCGPT